MDYLSKLNAAQKEAVTTTEGFVRVIAGAGSGKTRALSYRFAYLVNEMGILPGNILCVTFTNKAANEMRQRIHNITGDNDTGYINTFHGFCVSILQEDSNAVQYPKSFLVLDNSDIDAMLKGIYEERGLTLRDMTFSDARDMIEMLKIKERPDYYQDMITMPLDVLKEKYMAAEDAKDIIFYGYLYQEKKCFGLDYNDLIKFSLYIFKQDAEIRQKWQERLEYIMIDEFQDIDPLQYELMEVLCAYHKNLFIVGDPDQTIYTWRGANVKYLLDFDQHFPDVKTIMMVQNYRSTPEILHVVNSMIDKNKQRIPKDLEPMLDHGDKVVCHYAKNAEEEANWIAEEILKLTGAEKGEDEAVSKQAASTKKVSPRDITLLYRAHYVTRTVEEVFLKKQIPYTIYSGVPFFGRMEIKDVLSYLRMIAFKDDLSFARVVNVPKRNMGERRMAFLKQAAEEQQCSLYDALKLNLDNEIFKGTKASKFVELIESFAATYADRLVSEVLADIIDKSGYEIALRTEGSQERLDNLAELKQSVYEYETSCGEEASLIDYLNHVALFSNTDVDMSAEKVKLMTVHAAKGLEFPYVFLLEMNEGVFPSRKISTLEGMEEERRLAFVAMTRAEKKLFLANGYGWNFDGSRRYPSRFLLDIDQELLEFTHEPDDNLIRDTREYIESNQRHMKAAQERVMLEVGTRIHHHIMGDGTITAIDEKKGAYVIQFDELSTPRNVSFKAKIDKV